MLNLLGLAIFFVIVWLFGAKFALGLLAVGILIGIMVILASKSAPQEHVSD